MRLLIFILFTSSFVFSQENQTILLGNYNSLCLNDSLFIASDSLPESLENVQVIMLLSGSTSNLNHDDVERIVDFVENGGGLYSGAENWPMQAESNQVTHRIYKKESYGEFEKVNAQSAMPSGNLALNSMDSIPAGNTTVAFPMDYRLKVEAWVEDQPIILSGQLGKGRIIIDGGYSRFYCINRTIESDELLRIFLEFLSP